MPNVMVALLNTGGALCSTPQSLADAQYWSAVQYSCQDAVKPCLDYCDEHNILPPEQFGFRRHSLVKWLYLLPETHG